LPLHLALQFSAPVEVVSALIAAWPGAVKKEMMGGLPLHFVAQYTTSPPLAVVSALIAVYPGAVKERNIEGWLPLHLAARNLAPPDFVSALISAWPGAVRKETPLGSFPLHLAAGNSAHEASILSLINAWPLATKKKNAKGWLPLHLAVWYSAPVKAISALIKAWPGSVMETIPSGLWPMQLLSTKACTTEHDKHVARKLAWQGSPLYTDSAEIKAFLKIFALRVIGDHKALVEFDVCLQVAQRMPGHVLHRFCMRGSVCIQLVARFLLPQALTLRGLISFRGD